MTLKYKTETLPVTNCTTGAPVGIHESCTVTLQGREFTSGGAHADPTYIFGYVRCEEPTFRGTPVTITNWDGLIIMATGRITALWRTTHSHYSSHLHQVRVTLTPDFRAAYPQLPTEWTGRTRGKGLYCHLRPVRPRKSRARKVGAA